MAPNCPLNAYLYTNRSVQLSNFIKEVSLCSGWWLMQKLLRDQFSDYQRIAQPQIGTTVSLNPQSSRGRYGRGCRRVMSQRWGRNRTKQCLWALTKPLLQDLTAPVFVCTWNCRRLSSSTFQHGGWILTNSHHYLRSYGQLITSEGWRVSFRRSTTP